MKTHFTILIQHTLSHSQFKPKARPNRFLSRSLDRYKLTHQQLNHLNQYRSLPKIEKRPRPMNINRACNPPDQFEINFLGTSAGKPTTFRNPSSLAVRMDGDIWMFDCGEATTHQMMRTTLKASNVKKIFITHLHGDHVLGLISFLAHISDRIDADLMSENQHPFSDPSASIEIFGPSGIREFVRTNLRLTQTHAALKVKVNELLRPSRDRIYGPSQSKPEGRLWHTELLGEDLWADEDGVWRDIVGMDESGVSVGAAPIAHRIDCVGYMLVEANRREKFDMSKLNPIIREHADEIKQMGFKAPQAILSKLEQDRKPITFSTGVTLDPPKLSIQGRKVVILGDTSDPTPILTLISKDPDQKIDLLVHESTGTSVVDLNPSVISALDTNEATVAQKMRDRGHSTSFMAGQFARQINAKRMVMNHVGGKFPSPLGCVCPSPELAKIAQFPRLDRGQRESLTIYDTCLKSTASGLWKMYEEMNDERQGKVVQEVKWIKSVAADAVNGWRVGCEKEKEEVELEVVVAHDFLQVKIPRSDLI
ncbi:beta-lactamase-like protein [Melampsora americana]|nr:beta-lactamase-like protein [Melampsora americana]